MAYEWLPDRVCAGHSYADAQLDIEGMGKVGSVTRKDGGWEARIWEKNHDHYDQDIKNLGRFPTLKAAKKAVEDAVKVAEVQDRLDRTG